MLHKIWRFIVQCNYCRLSYSIHLFHGSFHWRGNASCQRRSIQLQTRGLLRGRARRWRSWPPTSGGSQCRSGWHGGLTAECASRYPPSSTANWQYVCYRCKLKWKMILFLKACNCWVWSEATNRAAWRLNMG